MTSAAGQLHLGVVVALDDDGEHAGAVLAGGLGDQLLGPVGEPDDAGAVVDEHQLVAQRRRAADGRAEAQRRVGVVVGGEQVGHRLGVVEQRLDVDPGEPARDEPERGEGRVAAADSRVGVDDAVAGLAGLLVERAARVGDDDDALGGVDAGVA